MSGTLEERREELEISGRVWFRGALSEAELLALEKLSTDAAHPGERLDTPDRVPCVLRESSRLMNLIRSLLAGAQPVRMMLFNEPEATNWSVPWHQDRVIAVAARHEVDGFVNWSRKSGTWHCEPPLSVLDSMLFVRVHLDEADARNGAMEIALGSHKRGRVTSEQAEPIANEHAVEICAANRGDVQVLKMGVLHRSRPSTNGHPRRAVRIDFSADELPRPLEWSMSATA